MYKVKKILTLLHNPRYHKDIRYHDIMTHSAAQDEPATLMVRLRVHRLPLRFPREGPRPRPPNAHGLTPLWKRGRREEAKRFRKKRREEKRTLPLIEGKSKGN